LRIKQSISASASVTSESVKIKLNPKINRRPEFINECEIIGLELESLRDRRNVKYCFFEAKPIYDTLILMIDTSIYDFDHATEYLPCYHKFFEKNELYINKIKPLFTNIEELRRYQLIQIIKALLDNPNITSLIIVGHHPIYQLKNKTIKDPPSFITEYKSDIHIDFTPVLEIIFIILPPTTKYYYLCSDLHLYQEGEIEISFKNYRHTNNMMIQQYIVGSGGTELDPKLNSQLDKIKYDSTDSNHNTNIRYTFIKEEHKYGFLDCLIERGKAPTFKFIPISDIPMPNPIFPSISRFIHRSKSFGGKSKRKYKRKNYKKTNKKYY
jgi:hypothetical protein